MSRGRGKRRQRAALAKVPTGIQGLDAITGGGLPRGRPTLICGGPGSGKTLFATEFLVRGAAEHGETGVMMCFEETAEELAQNAASLGFDLDDLVARKKLVVDYVLVDPAEIRETGVYSLDGLFARLGLAIDSVAAKRVVLDSIETLFAGLGNVAILRTELRRLFRWLKTRGVTSVITAELGEGKLTRNGLEEYVSDCVIFLDHRVVDQFATRRLRVVKYRGSKHGADEHAFLIGDDGISVLPVTSLRLDHQALTARVPSGVPGLDAMLGGRGYYRGGSILVSGTSGTGKTSLTAHLMDASCRRGNRCLGFLFEESPSQLVRNMRSIGIDLQPWIDKGLLRLQATRPTSAGMESHLVAMHKAIDDFRPHVVTVDPITNLASIGTHAQTTVLLTRLIDFLKTRQITALFASLNHGDSIGTSDVSISSLMDTWLLVRDMESNGERNRVLYVLKSRGMAHSNQLREFRLTGRGIELVDVYVGMGGVLTGTARMAQEARDAAERLAVQEDFERQGVDLAARREALRGQIAGLRADLAGAAEEQQRVETRERAFRGSRSRDRLAMARARMGDIAAARKEEGSRHGDS